MKIHKRNWLVIFLAGYGGFILLPFLAPLMMTLNFDGMGKAIYFVYNFLCHQLPERSIFLFGSRLMYSLGEIQFAWRNTNDPLILRQFIGNEQMGWKVAWSDRMISMYGGVWLAGLSWATFRKFISGVSIWVFIALALPMALDGITHFISDLNGPVGGFRYTNHWLVILTQNYFPVPFYMGDSLGSFNSLAR